MKADNRIEEMKKYIAEHGDVWVDYFDHANTFQEVMEEFDLQEWTEMWREKDIKRMFWFGEDGNIYVAENPTNAYGYPVWNGGKILVELDDYEIRDIYEIVKERVEREKKLKND